MKTRATREAVLRRDGLVFFDDLAEGFGATPKQVQAVEVNLAQLGYVPTARLAARLARLAPAALAEQQQWLWDVLCAKVGGGQKHEPLFRSFPDDIPANTFALYVQKVLVYYAQAPGQQCLWCGARGTTHVLEPCHHVVCDRCFDGASYSACPACERPVDRSSPFFLPPARPKEGPDAKAARFVRLDVATETIDDAARRLVRGFCARTQAMSPDDKATLVAIVGDFGAAVADWLPAKIAVRENTALIFGTLLMASCDEAVLALARRHLTTATDVLRLVAVASGTDGSLQKETKFVVAQKAVGLARWTGYVADKLAAMPTDTTAAIQMSVAISAHRFAVAKLPRRVRRALLAILDGLREDALVEDMLRHRSLWVWIGEFLHPREYATRYPKAARAFAIVRDRKAKVATWGTRVAALTAAKDVRDLLALLAERPGELARRFDHLLRLAGDDAVLVGEVLAAFAAAAPRLTTPALVGIHAIIGSRARTHATRVYWPRGATTTGYTAPETRPPLRGDVIGSARRAAADEVLARFAKLPAFGTAVLDAQLADVIVPFNERTAARAAVALPRGSRIPTPPGATPRLFLHWCEPPASEGGRTTDIDLSTAFYTADWRYQGNCSYRELVWQGGAATHSGDLRAAPPPDGATEFVDLDRAALRAGDTRYVVMTVNNYAGMAFAELARGFAGLMMRDDTAAAHFDPRTAVLRFDVAGANGVFVPLVLDFETNELHWLDIYSKGELAFNDVESSAVALAKVCPTLIGYFASGARPTMFALAAMHAAARAHRVIVRERGGAVMQAERGAGEPTSAFLARILERRGFAPGAPVDDREPVFAALVHRDRALHPGSTVYALFGGEAGASISASDLLA